MGDLPLWVAIAAAAPGVLALALAIVLYVMLRRSRAAQRVLLPDGTPASLIDRQASLSRAMERLEGGLRDQQLLSQRQGEVTEQGLRDALRFLGLVRYDAYRDMGGQQSWSIALVDSTGTGAIVTSLHSRDHARVYLKELAGGIPSQRLSPEEERALAGALGRPPGRVSEAAPVASEAAAAGAPAGAPTAAASADSPAAAPAGGDQA